MKCDISVINKESGKEQTVQGAEGMVLICQMENKIKGIIGGDFNWLSVLDACLEQGMPRDALILMDAIWKDKEKTETEKQN